MSACFKLCPRCGSRYSSLISKKQASREYLYAVHLLKKEDRWIQKWCYLGPREYLHAAKLHSQVALGRIPLKLRGAGSRERLLEYLEQILDAILGNPDLELRDKAIRMLQAALSKLEQDL